MTGIGELWHSRERERERERELLAAMYIIIIIIIMLLDLLARFRPGTINKLFEGDADAKMGNVAPSAGLATVFIFLFLHPGSSRE